MSCSHQLVMKIFPSGALSTRVLKGHICYASKDLMLGFFKVLEGDRFRDRDWSAVEKYCE